MKSVLAKIIPLPLILLLTYTLPADPKNQPVRPLKDLAARHKLLIGTAVDPWRLEHPELSKIIVREFNSISGENEMKCFMISRGRDNYYFKPADQLVAFAEKNKMKVRGHTLVWHQAVPGWVKSVKWTKESMLQWLKEYITTVVTHFKGKIYSWDVVNEAFEANGKYIGGLKSFWYKTCGPDYIEKAFVWAREADPAAKLYLNDVSCEYKNRQSNAIYEWIKDAKARGIPIDGIGFQAHFTEGPQFNADGIRENFTRFRDLGLELQFTEVDVRIDGPPTESTLASQAAIYAKLMKLALEFKMPAFTTWGVSDEDSWVEQHFPKGFQAALLFDKQYQPKPAYFALQEVLAASAEKKK